MKAQDAASNPLVGILNAIIKAKLPAINSAIQGAIRDNHLDPWGQVASGQDTFGSINLGVCHASVGADYNVNNMRGLSGFSIANVTVQSLSSDPSNSNSLSGTITLDAGISGDLSTGVGGGVEAKCGFIHPHVGISGKATVSGTTVHAAGSFTASLSDSGSKICLDKVSVSNATIDYGNVHVTIDGLGIFNSILSPLIDAIVGLFKGQIRSAIASALTPILNSKINGELPLCQNF